MAKTWCWNCFGRGRELRPTKELDKVGPGIYYTYAFYFECRYCGGTGELDYEQWTGCYWLTKSELERARWAVPVWPGR